MDYKGDTNKNYTIFYMVINILKPYIQNKNNYIKRRSRMKFIASGEN